jgi:hypothetical protein
LIIDLEWNVIKENERMESVLKMFKTRVLAWKSLNMYKVGGEDVVVSASADGSRRETGMSGERARCCQCGHVQLRLSFRRFREG